MKFCAVEYMAKKAAENFKFKDVTFNGFDAININEEKDLLNKDSDFSAGLDIWAELSIKYDGTPPESYRIINKMIQDWVDDNEKDLKNMINPKLAPFLKERYDSIDLSDLSEDFDDYIWEDQVDYMPDIDEDNNKINFVVELVLEIEDDEED